MSFTNSTWVIDENENRANKLVASLCFIGEHAKVATATDVQESALHHVETVFLGALTGHDHETLIKSQPETPFILIGETLRPLLSLANVIGILAEPFAYAPTTELLRDCQEYKRHLPNLTNSQNEKRFDGLIGATSEIEHIRFLIQQVAKTNANVLILGESGTGKEVVARNIHLLSNRNSGPFIPVNCGAIPGDLLESELFGHEKGAFTGAISTRKGRFEMAQGGTLFLDEIGDMPSQMQVKLLRVLQERVYERVGGGKPIKADVRIIAATHRNLETMIEEDAFREDLYYRLNVFPIENPSLRERKNDVPLLLQELIKRNVAVGGANVKFTERALDSLKEHGWPGNVRELSNLVERMQIMFPEKVVDVSDLPKKYQHIDVEEYIPEYPEEILERQALNDIFSEGFGEFEENDSDDFDVPLDTSQPAVLPAEGIELKSYLAELEVCLIEQALERNENVVARAAEVLGVRRTTLVEKMKKYNLNN